MTQTRPLTVLITGGARGIGRGLTRNFLEAGHRIFILDSNNAELEYTATQASMWGTKGHFAQQSCNLADRRAMKEAIEKAGAFFEGKLDVLINNAFATPHTWSNQRTMDDESDSIVEEWDTKIAVGLTAPFLLSRLCLPLLKAASPPGNVINISSTRAYQSELDHEAYSAAKAGLLGLTQAMSVSLGQRYHIRVNAIIPGWIHVETENKDADAKGQGWEEGLTEADHGWHSVGRVGKVEDVVKAVQYLINADFVTGQEIVVDGGVGRKMVYPE